MESSDSSWVTMFVCANCARPGKELTSARRIRPEVPDFGLQGQVRQIVVPCAGRLQPENVLKAFEIGSEVVSIVACEEDNCHYAEGSRRCALRAEFIQSLLAEIGLGEGRLLLSHLPGSAVEDMRLESNSSRPECAQESIEAKISAIRDQILEALRVCPPNPLKAISENAANADVMEEMAVIEGEAR